MGVRAALGMRASAQHRSRQLVERWGERRCQARSTRQLSCTVPAPHFHDIHVRRRRPVSKREGRVFRVGMTDASAACHAGTCMGAVGCGGPGFGWHEPIGARRLRAGVHCQHRLPEGLRLQPHRHRAQRGYGVQLRQRPVPERLRLRGRLPLHIRPRLNLHARRGWRARLPAEQRLRASMGSAVHCKLAMRARLYMCAGRRRPPRSREQHRAAGCDRLRPESLRCLRPELRDGDVDQLFGCA